MQRVSQTTSQQLQPSSSSPQHLHPRLLTFIAFQRTCATVTSAYINLICVLIPFHTFTGYLLLSFDAFSDIAINLVTFMRESPLIIVSLQICIYLFNGLLIVCPLLADEKHKGQIWYTTLKRVIGLYPILARLSLSITSTLLYLQFLQSLPALFLTILVNLFNIVVVGNYHLKKEQNYRTTAKGAIILQIGIITHITVNCLLVQIGNFMVYCTCAAAMALLYLIWYMIQGYRLFVHSTARKIHLAFSTLLVASGLNFLMIVSPFNPSTQFNFINLVVLLIAVGFFLSVYEEKRRFTFENPENVIKDNPLKLKQNQLNMDLLLEESDNNKDKQNLLVGMIAHHIALKCPYERCWSKRETVYDPVLKHEFISDSIVREKDSVLRFYIKCLYERALEEHSSKRLMMDYCEFALNQFCDFSRHTLILNELSMLTSLGFLQKIKLAKLRLILLDQSEAFNRIIHGGKIQLLQVLNAQNIYEDILNDVEDYCHRSAEVWKDTTQREVNITELKNNLSEMFGVLPQIDHKWSKISKFLHVQKQWKYVYLNYVLFLKNQKVKNKDMSIGDNIDDDHINEGSPLNQKKEQVLADHVFFDKKAAIIMTYLDQEGLKFDRVNRSFQTMTQHKASQVVNCSLNMILPKQIREGHHDTLARNFVEGQHTTDEHSYYVKYTHFVTKHEEDVPALVIFKIYVELTSNQVIKLLCLMKGTQKSTEVALGENDSIQIFKQVSKELFEHQTSWSLNPSLNIFLKDENLQPAKHNNPIIATKWLGRLLTLSLVVTLIALPLKLRVNMEEISQVSYMEKYFVDIYNYPMVIAERYYSLILGVGNRNRIKSRIMALTNMFKYHEDHPQTTKTIFNPTLNLPKMYPPHIPNTYNQNLSYNQIDLFYLILSNIATLSSQTNISTTSLDFQQLHSYLTPSFDLMMNSTKHEFHTYLKSQLSLIALEQFGFIIAMSLVLAMAGTCIGCQIFNYYRKMGEVLDIIVQFSNPQIDKIVAYWHQVSNHFRKLSKTKQIYHQQYSHQHDMRQSQPYEVGSESVPDEVDEEKIEKNGNNVNLNQKHKEIIVGPQQRKNICKIIGLILLFLGGLLPAILVIPVSNHQAIQQATRFQQAGYYLLCHFPTTSIASYALLDKYYATQMPSSYTFDLNRFKDTLGGLRIIMNYTYVAGFDNSQYGIKEKAYLFGNPCVSGPQLMITNFGSIDSCLNLQNRALTSGITTYIRTIYPRVEAYLTSTATPTVQQLNDLSAGLNICSVFFTDAITTWQVQFSAMLTQLQNRTVLYSIILALLMVLLHLIIFEKLLLSHLRTNYQFMREVFAHWVPEHILTKEKIIKHRFYKSGILSAS